MAAGTTRWPRGRHDGRGDDTIGRGDDTMICGYDGMRCGYDGVGVGGRLSMLWLWGE